MLRSIVGQW